MKAPSLVKAGILTVILVIIAVGSWELYLRNKGFETTYMFSKLLLRYPKDFLTHLNDKSVTIFNEYNFRPVYLKKNARNPDYQENKHLYVMRILNGAITREW